MKNYNIKNLTDKEIIEIEGGLPIPLLAPVLLLAPVALGVYVGWKAAENANR